MQAGSSIFIVDDDIRNIYSFTSVLEAHAVEVLHAEREQMIVSRMRYAAEKGSFLADEAQLELALVNLIINARDAMPNGGNIRIFTGSAPDDAVAKAGLPAGEYPQVRVSDEGTGIPESLVARVTEPFFTSKQVGKGAGWVFRW